jgi:hypothetical protein
MIAAAVLERAKATGLRLFVNEAGRLQMQADRTPPAELLADVKAHRAELVAELLAPSHRAALALRRLEAMAYPISVDIDRWRLFVTDSGAFLAEWGRNCMLVHWSLSDLFSMPGGLLWELGGRETVALSPAVATMRAPDAPAGQGATKDFCRPGIERSLPWELAS